MRGKANQSIRYNGVESLEIIVHSCVAVVVSISVL